MAAPALDRVVSGAITLRGKESARVGGDRIALLRAIRANGSISSAARDIGLSYKAAWDAVHVMNNLFDQALVVPSAGGRDGGNSMVTAAGAAVIDAFAAAETELAAAIAKLEAVLSATGAVPALIWSLAMKTSARNALRGTITGITAGAVDAEVTLRLADDVEIVAIVTRDSVTDLGLVTGMAAIALIKASFVILARGDQAIRTSARNCLAGTVVRREDGTINSEVTLELTVGKTLTATLTRESADALDLETGTRALALVKASHVILAIE